MLTISVKNFGPIAEGSVDLKPLTIFVGPSNTGKSYMATAVYAVLGAASSVGRVRVRAGRQGEAYWARRPLIRERQVSDIPLEALQDWVRDQSSHFSDPSEFPIRSLPAEIRSWLEKSIADQLRYFQRSVTERLRQIHGESKEFVRRERRAEEFRIEVSQDEPLVFLEILLNDEQGSDPTFDVIQTALPNVAFNLPLNFRSTQDDHWVWADIANSLVSTASDGVLASLATQSYYLPAARSGIAQGHKVLSAALVRQSRLIGIERLNIPTLPGITTEFLSHLISLDKRMAGPDGPSELNDASSFIETEVLRGRIDLDESVGLPYPEIVYEPLGVQPSPGKFTLEHTSSMVSELAPLVLFLKYLVRPGDLLILEEPESHLHPAAQLQMARGIARLVNAGVRVLITTHSNDFTAQINNLVRMSDVNEETWKSLGLEREECLQPDQVSAYGFRIDPDRAAAVTLPLTVGSDVGIEDEEFLPVIELLYEQAITLQRNRLS